MSVYVAGLTIKFTLNFEKLIPSPFPFRKTAQSELHRQRKGSGGTKSAN